MQPLLVTSLKGEVSNQYLARVQKAYRVILYLMSLNFIDIFQKTSACKYIWIMQHLKSFTIVKEAILLGVEVQRVLERVDANSSKEYSLCNALAMQRLLIHLSQTI